MSIVHCLVPAALFLVPSSLAAQDLATRVERVDSGAAVFEFTARPGICGDGEGMISDRSHGMMRSRSGRMKPCNEGPVRVEIDVRQGRAADLDISVGGSRIQNSNETDLGYVPVGEAVDYLLDLAETAGGDPGTDAIFAATLADSVMPWPRLFKIAKNHDIESDTRRAALFWLSQGAGDAATEGLADVAGDESQDDDIRSHAIFALSQVEDPRAITALIGLAKTSQSSEVRRKALFWLGQSDDPRVPGLFMELIGSRAVGQ
ncbi:MAG: HEAT repeat domain-containing protein [Gemmatimonadales bacterium]